MMVQITLHLTLDLMTNIANASSLLNKPQYVMDFMNNIYDQFAWNVG